MATSTTCDRCGAELGPGMRGLQLMANPNAPDPLCPRLGPVMDLCTPCLVVLERAIRTFLKDLDGAPSPGGAR